MNLLDMALENEVEKNATLAYRCRPTSLNEIVGQSHILKEGKLLNRLIKADKLSSIILYGPCGTGKTTIAYVIANATKSDFISLNAVTSGKKELQEVIEKAKKNLLTSGKKTILFIDEIHRFNKAQQDFLLPFVENSTIVLIGATTENPYFEVNNALISRSTIFKLELLQPADIELLIRRVLKDKKKGLGNLKIKINDECIKLLSNMASGDARKALNALELAVITTPLDNDEIIITKQIIIECMQNRTLTYDKGLDEHYDTISAFIKSMRGSDVDASIYYLSKMIEAGEDINFIARRITICAAEDVGLANPNALVVANAAMQAIRVIGLPEARIILAEATAYVASSPKSNASYMALEYATKSAKTKKTTVPIHLRDSHYKGSEKLGHGLEYMYPHNFENHYCDQQYLPDEIKSEKFYYPTDIGEEKTIKNYLDYLKKSK